MNICVDIDRIQGSINYGYGKFESLRFLALGSDDNRGVFNYGDKVGMLGQNIKNSLRVFGRNR